MSKVVYDGEELKLVRINGLEQSVVYDPSGSDYESTHFVLDMNCVWNPAATHFGVKSAAGSVAALRHKLLQPRKQLRVTVGAETLLESPRNNATGVDATVGPKPIRCDVLRVIGYK